MNNPWEGGDDGNSLIWKSDFISVAIEGMTARVTARMRDLKAQSFGRGWRATYWLSDGEKKLRVRQLADFFVLLLLLGILTQLQWR